jgi:hypothetical protein
MESDDFLCSRNARPQKGGIGSCQTILLARRTRTMKRCSSDARSEGQSGCSLLKRDEQAWRGERGGLAYPLCSQTATRGTY